ncbi:hypothetical protein Syun_014361 [Stephania yunnanensis]|uniref:Uncharacterized protein n=1 Tax=Stephania yunnanensis TaxID=152371 RepID=A0AAP0JK95_9MAGN
MSDLKQGLTRIHGYPSHKHNRFANPIYDNTTPTTTTTTATATMYNNFGRQGRTRAPRMNYDSGGGIEFGSQKGGGDEESSGVVSPPLWKTSPSASPPTTETTPLQSNQYNHHHYRLLSPESRTQAILRGRQELMEMVKQMPETSYELSLKDLVELPKAEGLGRTTLAEERERRDGAIVKESERQRRKNNKNKKNDKGRSVSRSGSGSMGSNGPFLLKMFFPISLGWKKKSSPVTGTCSKVSPRPMAEGEKSEKDWWKKRLSVVGEYGSSRSGSSSSSGGGSINSSSTSSRNKRKGFACACWAFIWTK